uniref:Uncharacterized protein n=1 Tax=Timema monikensis TaxID=170555 RepID=A0A7R9EGB1_9NEOP|nr:unnamed protein product [Timema monikensis]
MTPSIRGNWHYLHQHPSGRSVVMVRLSTGSVARRMRWTGHAACMGDDRRVYNIIVEKPEDTRPLGSPRWEDSIGVTKLSIIVETTRVVTLAAVAREEQWGQKMSHNLRRQEPTRLRFEPGSPHHRHSSLLREQHLRKCCHRGGFELFRKYSSPVASLVLTDSSQLTSDSQHLDGGGGGQN